MFIVLTVHKYRRYSWFFFCSHGQHLICSQKLMIPPLKCIQKCTISYHPLQSCRTCWVQPATISSLDHHHSLQCAFHNAVRVIINVSLNTWPQIPLATQSQESESLRRPSRPVWWSWPCNVPVLPFPTPSGSPGCGHPWLLDSFWKTPVAGDALLSALIHGLFPSVCSTLIPSMCLAYFLTSLRSLLKHHFLTRLSLTTLYEAATITPPQ